MSRIEALDPMSQHEFYRVGTLGRHAGLGRPNVPTSQCPNAFSRVCVCVCVWGRVCACGVRVRLRKRARTYTFPYSLGH